jgi:hypothetical protein
MAHEQSLVGERYILLAISEIYLPRAKQAKAASPIEVLWDKV